nr:putative phthalate 4,5-dioxygenase oxygenase subunit (OhpA2) [uncultured bacterium]
MPIYDRSKENLGVSDSGAARTRRVLLEAARKLATEEIRPASAQEPDKFLVRAISIMIPAGGDWMAHGKEFMQAQPGKGFGYTP